MGYSFFSFLRIRWGNAAPGFKTQSSIYDFFLSVGEGETVGFWVV